MIKLLQFLLYPVHVWWWGFASRWGLISFKKGGDAPPPPDYRAAAQAQGDANIEAARMSAILSNPNYVTPLGTQTVEYDQSQTFDQQGYNQALKDYNQQKALYDARSNSVQSYPFGGNSFIGGRMIGSPYGGQQMGPAPQRPSRSDFMTTSAVGQPTVTMELSPEEQAIFETDQRIRGQLGGLAEGMIGRVDDAYNQPFDFQSAADARNQSQEALMSRINPMFERERDQMEQRLANQGIPVGSEAWNEEMDAFNRSRTDARMQAILNAGQEQDRMVQLASFLRNMPLNELNALKTGAPVQMPQFQGFQGQNINPAPVYNAANQQYQANLGQYNAEQAGRSGFTSGLFGLGGSLLGAAGAAGGFGNLFSFGG